MNKKGLSFLSFLFLSFTVFTTSVAQTIIFEGEVLDEQGNRISGAEVMVDEIPYSRAITDASGSFILQFQKADIGKEIRIRIEKIGYKTWFRDIRINQNMSSLGLITLEIPPQAPRLISPANRDTLYDPTPTLEWEFTTGCTYNLQLDDQANFLNPEINEEGLAASLHESKIRLKDGTYYWRVQIEKGIGNYSEWSEPWILRIRDISPIQSARNRKAALRSLVVPGWGQRYKGRTGKWWGMSYGLSIGGAVAAHLIYDWQYDKYLEARSIEELDDAYDMANWARKIRNGLLVAIPAIAISSAIHAYSSKDARIKEEIHAGIGYDLNIRKGQIRFVFMKSF